MRNSIHVDNYLDFRFLLVDAVLNIINVQTFQTLLMKKTSSSETSVHFGPTTQDHIPDDRNFIFTMCHRYIAYKMCIYN